MEPTLKLCNDRKTVQGDNFIPFGLLLSCPIKQTLLEKPKSEISSVLKLGKSFSSFPSLYRCTLINVWVFKSVFVWSPLYLFAFWMPPSNWASLYPQTNCLVACRSHVGCCSEQGEPLWHQKAFHVSFILNGRVSVPLGFSCQVNYALC